MNFFIQFDPQQLSAYASNWRRFFFVGILLVILGLIAISTATFTTLLSVVFLGFIIFLSGILILFDTFSFWRGKWGGFLLHLVLGILYLWVGVMLIQNPVQGSVSLTFLLGIFYIVAGVFRIGFSAAVQMPRWGWSWFNGVVTLILGILILTSWPVSSLVIIGLFVGIDLLFVGWAYIMSALAARRVTNQ